MDAPTTAAILLPPTVTLGQRPATWNVDSARGPETTLEYPATQGTWISVDVSPDGRFIAFDLLGHLYEMPIGGGRALRLTDGDGARVFDLAGRTIIPGIIDAHAYDNAQSSPLGVVEQGHAGLLANLAVGVTTMYEVYGERP